METRLSAGFLPLIPLSELLLKEGYVLGLRTFWAIGDTEFYVLAFFQRSVASSLDGTIMHKNIRPAVSFNKAIALGSIEPFYFASQALIHTKSPPFLENPGGLAVVRADGHNIQG
jgi:hypothetical protein